MIIEGRQSIKHRRDLGHGEERFGSEVEHFG